MQRGFTLIELLIVLALLAMAIAIVPPYLPGVADSFKVKAAVREVVGALKSTRSVAVGRRKEAVLLLDVETRTLTVDGRKRVLNLPDDSILELATAESELSAESEGAVRFYPDGSATGGRISVQSGKQRYEINVHWLTGKVTVGSL